MKTKRMDASLYRTTIIRLIDKFIKRNGRKGPFSKSSRHGHGDHPRLGDFMPPVRLNRRMWAGGRLHFSSPLRLGRPATRHSEITSIRFKQGRSGKLAFVCVRHDYSQGGSVSFSEEHDIVYKAPLEEPANQPLPSPPLPAPRTPAATRHIVPDPVLLFRYSALTFNGHRIHYDRRYCLEEEGYPGLVVHGPLIATLLVELLGSEYPDRPLKLFQFKALSPLFDGEKFTVNCSAIEDGKVSLWAADKDGGLCMEAEAELG